MERASAGSLILVVALALGGCAANSEPSSLPSRDQLSPPSALIDGDSGESVVPEEVPQWDEASRREVVGAAQAAMTAFARPDLPDETWWAGLEPLLTTEAAPEYAYVDPANIPARKVTGQGRIVFDTSAYVATVEVPTDAGRYRLVLVRRDATTPWLVSKISPVEAG